MEFDQFLEILASLDGVSSIILIILFVLYRQGEKLFRSAVANATTEISNAIRAIEASNVQMTARLDRVEEGLAELRDRPGRCPHHNGEAA